jgi:hypothetical protein
MLLRTTALMAGIGSALFILLHFATFPYEILADYELRNWIYLLIPLLRELPISIFFFVLFVKQK